MAGTATRGQKKKTLLPGSLQAGLKQGANKLIGVLCLICAGVSWAALMSWSVTDPSLSRATDGAIKNIASKPGAIFSDILFQSFGLASIILVLPLAILGIRLFIGQPPTKIRLRALSLPFSIALLAITLTFLPTASTWPLTQSYGGIVGDTFASLLNLKILTSNGIIYSLIGFIGFLTLSIFALSFTTAIKIQDAQTLIALDNPQELKMALKAPIERFSYWLRARKASNPISPEKNQRLWWRNANWDETDPIAGQQNGPAIHMMPPPLMPKPMRPADFVTQSPSQEPSNHGQPPYTQSPNALPPMSAKPHYQGQPENEQGLTTNQKKQPRRTAHPVHTGQNEFILPPIELLNPTPPQPASTISNEDLREMASTLENVLLDFGVKGSILNVRPGPVVTLFEFEPARGIKTSRIIGLAEDIARSMSALSARIAVIPGRNAIGIELPNAQSETVYLRELVEQPDFYHTQHTLPLILGKAIGGEAVITDLTSMPHLLIAGTTGSGKSVGINAMLLSLLYRLSPKECRMIMIDPKMLELSIYDGIPHLLTPVVTDPHKALSALKWAVREMEDRYRQMSKLGVRNIHGFNEKVNEAIARNEPISRTVQTGFDQETGKAIFEQEHMTFEPMPMIVVVIDEMADLMMVAGKEIEIAVQRLAQMARAAGIHVIMATQRPSVDVITGTIKANFPTRISFQVTSKIDSRTILGKEGAEQLLGHGDMLFMPGGSRTVRVHGAFVDDSEVENVVRHLRAQGSPQYLDTITLDEDPESQEQDNSKTKGQDIYGEAVEIVLRDQKASISYLQRRLSIGYNRAATLIERMENEGIVSPANRSGKREILIDQV